MDLLAKETRPFLDSALMAGDSTSVLYAATAIAQGYIVDDNLDSVKTYLDFISSYSDRTDDPKLNMVLQNVRGSYAHKAELDYSYALSCFMDGYRSCVECRDSLNSVIMLSNIVSIYFARNDKNGLEYAERARQTVEDLQVGGFTRCVAYISFKALSDEVGYSDISVFYRAFKRETGCTPAIYRAQILKMDSSAEAADNS